MGKELKSTHRKSPINNLMPIYSIYAPMFIERVFVYIVALTIGGLIGQVFYGGLFKANGESTTATFISNTIVFIIMGLIGIKLFYPMYIEYKANKRLEKLKTQFRDMMDSLSASFSAGSNVLGAFRAALSDLNMQYNEKDMIIIELSEMLTGIEQNVRIDIMLRDFGERSENEDILNFADIFEACYQKGGDIRSVVRRTHNVISEKMAIANEIKTKLTSNIMQNRVMSIMPIGLVIMLRLTNPSFADNFATPMGVVINTIALGIFIGAYKMGQRFIKIN